MSSETDVHQRRGPDLVNVTDHRGALACAGLHRVWDLHPGDRFHGRTIVAVHGVVGLASSPVAVLSLKGKDPAHPTQARIGAAHPDVESGCDEVRRAACAWVRCHGLHEGEAVDLERLRTEVLDATPVDQSQRPTCPWTTLNISVSP